MSIASRKRSRERWESMRTALRTHQNRRSELLQFSNECSHCGRGLQTVDRLAMDFACLHSQSDRLYCRGCILAGAFQLLQMTRKEVPAC